METAKELEPTERLYQSAFKSIGQNLAPGNEMLGCAISMCAVYNRAFPEKEPLRFVNTTQWYDYMKAHPELFKPLLWPEPKCIRVNPTEHIPAGSPLKHGHIFVVGKKLADDKTYYTMSNNSQRGVWDTQWTNGEADDYYVRHGKIPSYYFRVL